MSRKASQSKIENQTARLGSQVEAFRLSRNMRQVDLARSAGVARSTLARFEGGGGGSIDTLIRILRALDLEDRMELLVPDASKNPLMRRERQRARPRLVERRNELPGNLPALPEDGEVNRSERRRAGEGSWDEGGSLDRNQWSKRRSGFFGSSTADES